MMLIQKASQEPRKDNCLIHAKIEGGTWILAKKQLSALNDSVLACWRFKYSSLNLNSSLTCSLNVIYHSIVPPDEGKSSMYLHSCYSMGHFI